MVNLTRANRELFRRSPDETFSSLKELHDHCRQERHYSSRPLATASTADAQCPG